MTEHSLSKQFLTEGGAVYRYEILLGALYYYNVWLAQRLPFLYPFRPSVIRALSVPDTLCQ